MKFDTEVYAARVSQDNSIAEVTSEEFIDLVKRYKGAAIMDDGSEGKYLGTFVFASKSRRDLFAADANMLGVNVTPKHTKCFMPKEWADGLK